jgi:hypothetical protein
MTDIPGPGDQDVPDERVLVSSVEEWDDVLISVVDPETEEVGIIDLEKMDISDDAMLNVSTEDANLTLYLEDNNND